MTESGPLVSFGQSTCHYYSPLGQPFLCWADAQHWPCFVSLLLEMSLNQWGSFQLLPSESPAGTTWPPLCPEWVEMGLEKYQKDQKYHKDQKRMVKQGVTFNDVGRFVSILEMFWSRLVAILLSSFALEPTWVPCSSKAFTPEEIWSFLNKRQAKSSTND